MRTSYPPLTSFSILPSTGRPEWNVLELPGGRRSPRQFHGELQPAGGRDHDGGDAVADRNLDVPLLVLQLRDVDRRFTFSADVDERHLGANRDDPALDGLPLAQRFRLDRRFEHRGEIFGLISHDMLRLAIASAARGYFAAGIKVIFT